MVTVILIKYMDRSLETVKNDLYNKGNTHFCIICGGSASGPFFSGFNANAEYDCIGSSFCICSPSHRKETTTIPAISVPGHTGGHGSGDITLNPPGDLLH